MTADRAGTIRVAWGMLAWAIHFAASYGAVTLLCTRGFATVRWLGFDAVTVAIVSMGAVALIALGVIAMRSFDGGARFADWIAAGVAALAGIAVAAETLVVLRGPSCE